MKAVSVWRALPRGVRNLFGVVLYLFSHLLLDTVSQAFNVSSGVSVWFLPAALALVILFVFGLQNLPVVFSAVVLAQLINDTSQPLFSVVVHGLTYSLVYGAAALLLRRLNVDPQLHRLRDVGWLMFLGAAAAPLVASLTSVTNFIVSGLFSWSQWPLLVLQYAAGDATGVGALAPFLLVTLRYISLPSSSLPAQEPNVREHVQAALWRWPNPEEAGRISLYAGSLALAAFLTYVVPRDLTLNHSYVTFIPLLLIAGWYGLAWAAAATLFINVCIALFTFSDFGSVEGIALQFGLVTLTHLGIALGAFASERKWSAARLHHLAFHDTLTGLPNRAFFLERLENAVNRAEHDTVAVLFIDLDSFRGINDDFGHPAGDAVLVEAARLLERCLRPGDVLARFDGDEFTVLLEVTTSQDAVRIAERIQKEFATSSHRAVQASIGVAVGGRGGDPDGLLRNVDTALRRAKSRSRGDYAVFDPAMHALELEQKQLEQDLRGALGRGEMLVYYQPIVSLETRNIVGAEALLRWQHPARGLVLPDTFIPVAERTGLIIPLGSWVVEQAFAQLGAWHAAGHGELFVSVNISARQMQHPQLVGVVQGALGRLGLAPEHVALELTESVFMEGDETIARFKMLQDAGVRLSIDDFGTGYSSLGYLKRLPVDTLKIDRAFLAGVPEHAGDAALVKTILAMAHTLNLNVVAEGVETSAQADFLQAHGCKQAQGYLFSRPVSAGALTALLEEV